MTFNKGDLIESKYGERGYYVWKKNGNHIMERIDADGWPRMGNPRLIPDDYVPIVKDSFWAMTPESYKLIEAAQTSYEIY